MLSPNTVQFFWAELEKISMAKALDPDRVAVGIKHVVERMIGTGVNPKPARVPDMVAHEDIAKSLAKRVTNAVRRAGGDTLLISRPKHDPVLNVGIAGSPTMGKMTIEVTPTGFKPGTWLTPGMNKGFKDDITGEYKYLEDLATTMRRSGIPETDIRRMEGEVENAYRWASDRLEQRAAARADRKPTTRVSRGVIRRRKR